MNTNNWLKQYLSIIGIHAREWISPATAVYIIDKLIGEFGKSEALQSSPYTKVNWLIVPVSNPDGYDYSHTTDRYWRKNRAPPALHSTGSNCSGVNINSNFGMPPPYDNKG